MRRKYTRTEFQFEDKGETVLAENRSTVVTCLLFPFSDDTNDLSSSLAPNTKPRLLQLSDKQWQEWRRLGFPINAHYEPVLDKTGREGNCSKSGISSPATGPKTAVCDETNVTYVCNVGVGLRTSSPRTGAGTRS